MMRWILAFGTAALMSVIAISPLICEREVMNIVVGLCFASWRAVSLPKPVFPAILLSPIRLSSDALFVSCQIAHLQL
jgi:hypothetical protein